MRRGTLRGARRPGPTRRDAEKQGSPIPNAGAAPRGDPGDVRRRPSGLPVLAALLEDSSTRTRSVSRGWSTAEPGGRRSREGVLPAEVTGAAVCSRDAGGRRWEAGGRDRVAVLGERSPLPHHSAKLRLRSSFSPAHSVVGPISEQVIQLVDKRSLIQKFQCVRTSELFPRKPKFVFSVFRGGLTQFKLRAVKD